jgi:hypothetical protein
MIQKFCDVLIMHRENIILLIFAEKYERNSILEHATKSEIFDVTHASNMCRLTTVKEMES